jgi:hypothetical protein
MGLTPRLIIKKRIPPRSSFFQAMMSKIVNMNEGIKCMRKAIICSQIVGPVLKASKANKLIKTMAMTQRILGV